MDQVMKFTAASWFQLLDLEDIFRLSFDLEKSQVDIKILDVSINGVSYNAIRALRDIPSEMYHLVDKLFIEKKIMWENVVLIRETIDACINSLVDLGADLNAYKANLLSTGKSEHLLLAEMIQVWASESDKAVEAFKMAKHDHELTNPGREPWIEDYVVPILGKFRSNTLKIIGEFIGLLESRSAIRNRAEQLYDLGLTDVMRYLRVNYKELKCLSYSITLVPRDQER